MSRYTFAELFVATLSLIAADICRGQPFTSESRAASTDSAQDDRLADSLIESGLTSQRKGDFRKAIAELDRSRKLRPAHPRAILGLSWLLATCPDDTFRDGRTAFDLASAICDPLASPAPESLTALAAACAELGDFARAEVLQERAVAGSRFSPDFHKASTRRLATIRDQKPIREGRVPLVILQRTPQESVRQISLEEALTDPADFLGINYLTTKTLLDYCVLAKAGAAIDWWIDEQPLLITSTNAGRVETLLQKRSKIYGEAIRRRGYARLAPAYAASRSGECDEWELGPVPALVEQDDFDIFLTQGPFRHMGVVIESRVVLRHDSSASVLITGTVADDAVVFTTPSRGGIFGTAEGGCALTLTPGVIEGGQLADAFAGRAMAHKSEGRYAAMFADIDQSLRLKQTLEITVLQAYLLATCPDGNFRDGGKAVAAAELAQTLVGTSPPNEAVSTNLAIALAAAYAEAGDFGSAEKWQEQVIALVPDEDRPRQRERLRLFQEKKPFHEDPAP